MCIVELSTYHSHNKKEGKDAVSWLHLDSVETFETEQMQRSN